MNVEHCVSLAASDTYWHYTCLLWWHWDPGSQCKVLAGDAYRADCHFLPQVLCPKMRIEDNMMTILLPVLPVWQFCMILSRCVLFKVLFKILCFSFSLDVVVGCGLALRTETSTEESRKKEEPIWSPHIRWWNIWLYTWENIWHTERAFFKDI